MTPENFENEQNTNSPFWVKLMIVVVDDTLHLSQNTIDASFFLFLTEKQIHNCILRS